jgi:hypothetical protein
MGRLLHHDIPGVFQMSPDPIAAILAVHLSLSCTRFLPLKIRANAIIAADVDLNEARRGAIRVEGQGPENLAVAPVST